MNAPWKTGVSLGLPKLNVSNALIDDADALRRAFERDGYWFFEDVLDHGAVERLRQAYVAELTELGIVDADDASFRYNGRPLDQLPKNPVTGTIKGMFERAPWREFVKEPAVEALIRKILKADPAWMPILGYRVAKPLSDPASERFDFVHQDGFFNPGIPFLNCWIPLVEMDEEVGGLAVAEGYHRHPDLHSLGQAPAFHIPVGAIPASAWRRADYKPGDLLVLHLDVPHSGITNVSEDRFRMSLDLRMLPADGPLPVIGTIAASTPDRIVIEDEAGRLHDLAVDEATYCRGQASTNGERIPASEIPENYPSGTAVIVAHRQGTATVVRPAAY